MKETKIENIYELDGRVPLRAAIPFGLQHVLAMFVANLTPIVIIAGAAGFDRQQQTELKKQCDKLDKKGVKFMLSNSSCDFIAKLYRDYRIEHVSAPRSVNAKADGRGRVEELLIMNY